MADAAIQQPDPIAASRRQLLDAFERETATTFKVLRAYPKQQSELRPHERCKTARELAWMFTVELAIAADAVRGQMDLSGGFPPAPETLEKVIAEFEAARGSVLDALRASTDGQLGGSVVFPTGPGEMGDWDIPRFLWFLLHDQIHHRGQFSIYLRMAGGKLPSIYGPTADEPWF